jgi:DNA-binding NtrC family response regulator
LPDLYERLCVNHIAMPQLEARRLDLADLCIYLTTQYCETWGMAGSVRITDDAKMHLLSASFEAQAHDLHIICKRAALRMRQDHAVELNVQDFAVSGETMGQGGILPEWLQTDLRTAREAFERWYFDHLMARFADNMTQVAQFAGMDRTALYRKLKSIKTDDDNSDTEAA